MSWTTPLLALFVVLLFWRTPAERRRDFLFATTVALVFWLSWQYLPSFGILRLQRSERLRALGGLGFLAGNLALVAFTVWTVARVKAGDPRAARRGLAVLIGLFVVSKWTGLQHFALSVVGLPAKNISLAGAWLGLSYVLFRLVHVVLEAVKGRLPETGFRDLVVFALFPASFLSGPIDRWPRFRGDLDKIARPFAFEDFAQGSWRLLVGMAKKFIIAEWLAGLPLDPLAFPPDTAPWRLWVTLYLYGFHLYFDFSGYTDMAIGLGRLVGFQLPENFDGPFWRQNIAKFWQSWHMSLSFWLRDYVFMNLGRTLRQRTPNMPTDLAVLICHLATMVLIGLWHAFTWPYALFGIWHALGLWSLKLWTDYCKRNHELFAFAKEWPRAKVFAAWFVTFHFVTLGWAFFGARDASSAFLTIARVFGVEAP